MKIFRLIYIWMALPLALVSCENFLDITPEGQVKRDDLLSTAEGIEDALYGVYSQMREQNLYGQELSFSALDLMAQYHECYGNEAVNALLAYRYDDTRVKDVFESIWVDMYKNISNVNSILNSGLVSEATEFPYSVYRAEALGLRAFMHFDLLRIYTEQITQNPAADGIPYATQFSLETPEFSTAAKVYEYILADLNKAEELLLNDEERYKNTSAFMNDRQIHFNLYAVQATLARVYLTMGNKEKALDYALKVIEHSGYTLSLKTEVKDDLAGVLSQKETVFGLYHAKFYSLVSPKLQQTISFSSLDPRRDIMDFYDADVTGLDYRSSAYFTAKSTGEGYRLSKLTNPYELTNQPERLPKGKILGVNLIRIPEMYYIAVECLLEKDYPEAVRLFNEVLTHRGLEPLENWPTPQNQLTMKSVNDERYREFIGEGQTFFNMKRQYLEISAVDGQTVIRPAKAVYTVPVPDIENDYRQ